MQFHSAFKTDVGQKRQQNQDNGACFPELGLFVVADGMGGHQGGERASAIAVEVIPEAIELAQSRPDWSPRLAICRAIETANQRIHEAAQDNENLHGMGTTTSAILFDEDRMNIGHVGDSRCYYLRPGQIWQLTRDHSLTEEKLRAGIITREQVRTDRMKNVITRSVGFEARVSVELYEMTVTPEDTFLLCSDGLSGMLDNSHILSVVEEELFQRNNIEVTVDRLIEAANAQGGDDNISALIVQVKE